MNEDVEAAPIPAPPEFSDDRIDTAVAALKKARAAFVKAQLDLGAAEDTFVAAQKLFEAVAETRNAAVQAVADAMKGA